MLQCITKREVQLTKWFRDKRVFELLTYTGNTELAKGFAASKQRTFLNTITATTTITTTTTTATTTTNNNNDDDNNNSNNEHLWNT